MPLKRWETICAVLGILLITTGIAGTLADPLHRWDFKLHAQGFTLPVTATKHPVNHGAGYAVIFHGLAVNRGLMTTLARGLASNGFTVYSVDLSGHGDNTDAFSFETAERSVAAALRGLEVVQIRSQRTVVIGHSMSGAIVIRLAGRYPAAATVALSPAPLVPLGPLLDRVRPYTMQGLPPNLLLIPGTLDLPMFEWAAHELVRSAGGARETPQQVRIGRALAVRSEPWGTHTGLVFRASVAEAIHDWALASWGATGTFKHSHREVLTRAALPVGVVLLFPATASFFSFVWMVVFGTWGESRDCSLFTPRLIFGWLLAAVCVAILLLFMSPLKFLGIVTGDYMASFLLLIVPGTLFFARPTHPPEFTTVSVGSRWLHRLPFWAPLLLYPLAGAVLAMLVILSLGAAVSGEWGDLWMNGARWWRFAALVPLLLPYFLLEESLLDAPSPRATHKETPMCVDVRCRQHVTLRERVRMEARRLTMFFTLRGIIWLSMVGALLFLGGTDVLVLVAGLMLAAFSFAQRVAADMVRRRFGSTGAAALFSAMLSAWLIAAVFPLR